MITAVTGLNHNGGNMVFFLCNWAGLFFWAGADSECYHIHTLTTPHDDYDTWSGHDPPRVRNV